MKAGILQIAGIICFVMLLTGCSGGKNTPVAPGAGVDQPSITRTQDEIPNNRFLLGLYDIQLMPESGDFEIIPQRGANFHCNIVEFFTVFKCMTLELQYENYDTGEFWVDFILDHPLPDSIYSNY